MNPTIAFITVTGFADGLLDTTAIDGVRARWDPLTAGFSRGLIAEKPLGALCVATDHAAPVATVGAGLRGCGFRRLVTDGLGLRRGVLSRTLRLAPAIGECRDKARTEEQ